MTKVCSLVIAWTKSHACQGQWRTRYVLHKEVDFRSPEELEKVQETILKLMGVGLEIKSGRLLDAGLTILMGTSPVDLFRIAHTRIEKLRNRWNLLLQDHRIEIMVSAKEYGAMSELTRQQLSEMSIFTEAEVHTIESLTLDDEMFLNPEHSGGTTKQNWNGMNSCSA